MDLEQMQMELTTAVQAKPLCQKPFSGEQAAPAAPDMTLMAAVQAAGLEGEEVMKIAQAAAAEKAARQFPEFNLLLTTR